MAKARRKTKAKPRRKKTGVEMEEFEMTATTKGWTPKRRHD